MDKQCHQHLMAERFAQSEPYNLFGAWWYSLELKRSGAVVSETTREAVAPIIEKYEWLGNVPDNCSLYSKLTFDGNIAGALAFSKSGFGGLITFCGHPAWKLTRGVTVFWAPKWASSFLINHSLRLLFTDPVFVVAFSDWEAGEIGTVYQAAGWTYLGHKMSAEWLSPLGERKDASFHKIRVVSGSVHTKTGQIASKELFDLERERMLCDGWIISRKMRGKYATVAGASGREKRTLLALLTRFSRPYPKRVGSVNGGHALLTSKEKRGSIPLLRSSNLAGL